MIDERPLTRGRQCSPARGCADEVAGGVAQARERRGGLRGAVVDSEVCKRVDHGAGSEQIFDGEAQRSVGPRVTRRHNGDHEPVALGALLVEHPVCGGPPVAQSGHHARERAVGRIGMAKHIHPDKSVGIHPDGRGAVEAPVEANLVLRLACTHGFEGSGMCSQLRLESLGAPRAAEIAGSRQTHLANSLRNERGKPGSRAADGQTGGMHVMLKLELDCTPDAAWAALRRPSVFRAVSAPFTTFTSLDPEGFPERWPVGDHRVLAKAFGLIPMGEQSIEISYPQRSDGVRVVRDSGGGVSGAVGVFTFWQHSMAVTDGPHGTTLYRDKLVYDAGILNLPIWPVMWIFWQWRAFGLRRFAPTWKA